MSDYNLKAAAALGQEGPGLADGNAKPFRLQSPIAEPDPKQARHFLQLLGKDPEACWFRAIRHGKGANRSRQGADLQGLDLAALTRDNNAGDAVYLVVGDAEQASGKGGGVTDADITGVPALFVEWDDMPLEWQANAWQTLGLPEPSVMVASGGKSLHCYWVLNEPLEPVEWRRITARLIAYCKSDSSCSNPSRVMRLPGFAYIDKKTGKPTGTIAEILHESGKRYSAAEIEACLPEPEQPAIPKPPLDAVALRTRAVDDWEPRGIEEISAAAEYIPQRVGGEQTYPQDRNALCGCAAALAAIGHPEEQALDLLASKWPDRATAAQILDSTTTRKAESFWAIARDNGYNLRRVADPLDGFKVIGEGKGQQQAQQTRFTPRPGSQANWGHRRMSHTKAMACFDRCVEVQAQRERNSLRRRARLLKAAADLELSKYVNRQEISQRVLEAKDRAAGRCFHALTADDRAAMERPTVEWLLPGLLPAGDLSIIGGRPKVGKTRLALALAGALLNGTKVFDQPAPTPTDVVLVSDDQADGDTADMLDALNIWNHPRLSWSRNFRLTEPDVDALLVAIRQRPGALVILDSLRSISRSLQYGENDPELGAILYDLKQAVIEAGGSLLIVHHCNKTADLVGVEALSGHSAIAGAANAILTMHYLPDDKGRPQKELPQRRLVREARSGQGLDIVLSPLAGSGNFYAVGTFSEWCRSQKEANEEQDRIGKMNPERKQILSLLAQDREAWLTRRQVCEAIGVGWGDRGRGKDPQRVGHGLAWLVTHGFAESVRAGLEATFKLASQGTQLDESIMTVMPSSDCKDSDPVGKNHDSHDSHDKPSKAPALVMTVMTEPIPSDSSSQLGGMTVMTDSHTRHPRLTTATIHIPPAAPQLFAIGDLVEVASRKYAPGGVFEVTEMEGDKLTIRGPSGPNFTPAHFLVPAAQCEVVF